MPKCQNAKMPKCQKQIAARQSACAAVARSAGSTRWEAGKTNAPRLTAQSIEIKRYVEMTLRSNEQNNS
jgi:hypothetical protein